LLGILVGGASTRMRGFPKGLLPSPVTRRERTLVEALLAEFRAAAPNGDVVLLGHNAAYDGLHLPFLVDAPAGIGPIGGLRALLLEGKRRQCHVLLCSCDMPFLDRVLLGRLLAEQPAAQALAAKRDGWFEPFPSRFDPGTALERLEPHLAAGRHSLVAFLQAMGASELVLEPGEDQYLRDWDEPSDVDASRPEPHD
jgi:molybdopterin-guanine dinucleotide biosynthesis protein A